MNAIDDVFFSGTVMSCTCSCTVTWFYLTIPYAFLNGKVHAFDLVLAYVYQNALLTIHFQLMYLLLNLILTLAYNPCDLFSNPTLFAYVLFQPPPWTSFFFSQPPSLATASPFYLISLFSTHNPQTIFTLTLFSLLCRTFPLSPWHHLPATSLPVSKPNHLCLCTFLTPFLELPPPPPFYLNPFPRTLSLSVCSPTTLLPPTLKCIPLSPCPTTF